MSERGLVPSARIELATSRASLGRSPKLSYDGGVVRSRVELLLSG